MITEKDLAGIERAQEIAADICMTEPYHTNHEIILKDTPDFSVAAKFISDFEMKMAELQADSLAAEKAARDNRPCEEIPF